MKYLFYLFILSFLLISCEEEVPPVTYTLTTQVTPEGAGSVTPSSGTYDEGESITIAATPSANYNFKQWTGTGSGTANPLTFKIISNTTITAEFELIDADGDGVTDALDKCPDTPSGSTVNADGCASSQLDTEIIVSTHEIEPPNNIEFDALQTTLSWTHGNFYYKNNDIEYLLKPGGGREKKSHPILFKKQNNKWDIHKVFTNVETEGVRQGYKIDESTFIMSDAAECYSEECRTIYGVERPGSFIWLIKVNGDDLIFEKIGDESWHHDIAYGDLDLDGDVDIVSTDGRIYYQTSNGWETQHDDLADKGGDILFAIDILDIDGGYPEIIQAAYLNSEGQTGTHGFRILKRNNQGKYDVINIVKESLLNSLCGGEFGASQMVSIDINNDGLNDLIIEREGEGGGCYGRTIEIYTGDGQGTFTPHDLIFNNGFINWSQYDLLDVNMDGFLDIIFTGTGEGSGLRLGNTFEDGFRLENLIYLNNGFGSFERINKELVSQSNATLDVFVPHINKENNLTFLGGVAESRSGQPRKIYFTEVIIKNL